MDFGTILCSLGLHKWSKWKVTERGEIIRTYDSGVIGNFFYQRRTCERCNKEQMDYVCKRIS